MLKWMVSIIIAGIVLAFTTNLALAAGVGVSPGRLVFDDSQNVIKATLHVVNTGETKADYELYAEDGYKDWFRIQPSNFSLLPDEALPVEISLSEMAAKPGEHHTIISVVAFNNYESSKIGSGIKVPVDISLKSPVMGAVAEIVDGTNTSAEKPASGMPLWPVMVMIGILAIGCTIGMLVIRWRRRVKQA